MFGQDDAREIAKKLKAEIVQGRRHDLAVFRYKGKQVAQFGISRGSKDQSHDYIPRQLYITYKQCRDLRDCPLTLEGYTEILANKQLLPPCS